MFTLSIQHSFSSRSSCSWFAALSEQFSGKCVGNYENIPNLPSKWSWKKVYFVFPSKNKSNFHGTSFFFLGWMFFSQVANVSVISSDSKTIQTWQTINNILHVFLLILSLIFIQLEWNFDVKLAILLPGRMTFVPFVWRSERFGWNGIRFDSQFYCQAKRRNSL